jgi:HlyD family secretion protein
MFPVEVNILNPQHLLKPGMNTEVEIHVAERHGVLAVPNAALRTPRDVASAASVLGLDPRAVERQVAAATPAPGDTATAPRDPSYIVFALRGGAIVPLRITAGLTDQDYIEVKDGLTERDTVLVLSGAVR